ncbi:uncharacterized protein F5147DRAFT_770217 [Suillus discolor]|uniref:Uncharacterized protein n=1 Tax=Suillus discolor TaxID=1912936 RepID=A0A9P7JWY4_9AGAM|nr:uncharacterized protein F5147DRAFT_770217 [Suillus discolor]KAG2114220.1 hypothetical protein F5147DRAFT_770217 [Suillus discolor]
MELQDHLDPVTRQSFLSAPVWRNIVANDSRIRKHPLYRKALTFISSSNPSAISHPLVQLAQQVIADALVESPVGSKPKPRPHDAIEIIDHVVATNVIGPDIRKGKGKQTAPPKNVDGDTPVEVLKAETTMVRQRPMPKRKQTQATSGCDSKSGVMDRKGKGKEVPPPVDSVDSDGHCCRETQHEQVAQSSHRRTTSKEYDEDPSPEAAGDVAKESAVGTNTININVATIDNAAPKRLSLPPVTSVSAYLPSSLESSLTVSHPAKLPPRHVQPPPSHTELMDIDVQADTVVKDLQAMTLDAAKDLVLVLKSHEDMYNTIHNLHNQVVELCARNAAAADSLEALNVRVAAQDAKMCSMETLHADVAMLQDQICTLQAESRTHENQLRAADVKLASQGSTTAVLQDAYEALRQFLIPTPSIPPHYNNTVFFPASHQHQVSYNQSLSVGQAQAMERLYFNFTPGPSMATGPLVSTLSASTSILGVILAPPGPSTVAGPSGMHAPSGPSGSHVIGSSQSTGNLGELVSAFHHN